MSSGNWQQFCATLWFQGLCKNGRFQQIQIPALGLHKLILICAFVFASAFVCSLPTRAQAQASASAIGQVETLTGSATVSRQSNRAATLKVGDRIYTGDTVSTGSSSILGITFLDRSVFSLSSNATMLINDLVYSPNSNANKMLINLTEGTFVFLAGRIAKTGNMIVDTQVAQIGIRGTQPWVTVAPTTSFTIMSERDGTTGEYVLSVILIMSIFRIPLSEKV